MKKRFVITGFVLLAIMAVSLIRHNPTPTTAAQSVKLTITGPDGERFTGSYTADGKTNVLNGVVPTTVRVRARELTYGFQPADRRQEFRVALDVENLHRTSFVSYQGGAVGGGWRCWSSGESAW